MKKEMVESIKEGLRVFLMAVVPLVVLDLEAGRELDLRSVAIAGVIALLRFIDKWLHESGVHEKGLTQF